MRQFITIASNAFMELIRQPVLLLLMTASAVFVVFLGCVPYFGFGDDPKLVKESTLAVTLLAGLLGAVLCASNSVAREIRSGTALAVLSKPVGRAQFLLAKFAGVALALVVLCYVNTVAVLQASRMAFDAYGDPDTRGLLMLAGAIAVAYLLGGFTNYFLQRPFVSTAVLALLVTLTLEFLWHCWLPMPDPTSRGQLLTDFAANVDWRLAQASLLILFAVWILAGLALMCSTRLELMSTLAVCSTVFLLGLISEYLFGKLAAEGKLWASACYALLPNWQLLWVSSALEEGKRIPWSYLGLSLGYVVAYVGATLAVGLCLFEDRELN
jgi:ABC-type transport system involved in multi-copper enzyme maturation permease subunit